MGAYRDAVLDSILDREALVHDHAGRAPLYRTHLAHAVVVASMSRDPGHVLEAARPLDRLRGLGHAALLHRVDAHCTHHHPRRSDARALDPEGWETLDCIGPADLEERRRTVLGESRMDERVPAWAFDRPPVNQAQRTLPGIVPDLADVGDMTDEQLTLVLGTFGRPVEKDRLLSETVQLELAQLTRAKNPDETLMEWALKRAEATVRRELMLDAKAAIRAYSMAQLDAGPDTVLRWLTVRDNRRCPSCIWRHGEKATLAEWEQLGVPGSDELICDGLCRCDWEVV